MASGGRATKKGKTSSSHVRSPRISTTSTSSRDQGGMSSSRQHVTPSNTTGSPHHDASSGASVSGSSISDNSESGTPGVLSLLLGDKHIDSTPTSSSAFQGQEDRVEDDLPRMVPDVPVVLQQVLRDERVAENATLFAGRNSLQYYVRTMLFPRKKFIFKDSEMDREGLLAERVLEEMTGIPVEKRAKTDWWNSNKKEVKKTINGKRNNVITVLKKEVLSK